jgi:hypothetical protein
MMSETRQYRWAVSKNGVDFYGRFSLITDALDFAKKMKYSTLHLGKFYYNYNSIKQFSEKINILINTMSSDVVESLGGEIICGDDRAERIISDNTISAVEALVHSFGYVGKCNNAIFVRVYNFNFLKNKYEEKSKS